jgi:hypothetical protein
MVHRLLRQVATKHQFNNYIYNISGKVTFPVGIHMLVNKIF